MSASYAPSHDHQNALLIVVKGPTFDCCAAERLWTFVDVPGPLTNLDYVGETDRVIVLQWQFQWDLSGLTMVTIARWQHGWVYFNLTASENRQWGKRRKIDFFTDAWPLLFIVVSKVTQVMGGLQIVATSSSSGRDSTGSSIEYDSKKEVSGESIVVISWKGHFCRTQTWLAIF